jgi:hypothetical protein
MMTKHATAAAKSPVLLKENITHYFINFTAHISRLHTEFEDLLLFLCISHFNISTLHSPPPLCPVTDKIAVPHQKGTRSRHNVLLVYLHVMSILQTTLHQTSCSTTIALDCLALAYGSHRLSQNVGMELPFYAALNPRTAQIKIIVHTFYM